ncbi:unnamed protein product [Polarella glacialis]|uniref:Secreted protein n=1 Tax=Polarella glacialis TaxID=89957 RepID=A0A813EWY5_POLGL|nr:unnamed protein product [Polarella glacialis]
MGRVLVAAALAFALARVTARIIAAAPAILCIVLALARVIAFSTGLAVAIALMAAFRVQPGGTSPDNELDSPGIAHGKTPGSSGGGGFGCGTAPDIELIIGGHLLKALALGATELLLAMKWTLAVELFLALPVERPQDRIGGHLLTTELLLAMKWTLAVELFLALPVERPQDRIGGHLLTTELLLAMKWTLAVELFLALPVERPQEVVASEVEPLLTSSSCLEVELSHRIGGHLLKALALGATERLLTMNLTLEVEFFLGLPVKKTPGGGSFGGGAAPDIKLMSGGGAFPCPGWGMPCEGACIWPHCGGGGFGCGAAPEGSDGANVVCACPCCSSNGCGGGGFGCGAAPCDGDAGNAGNIRKNMMNSGYAC